MNRHTPRQVRVLAGFGGMVIVAGMERMSFEVLRILASEGAVIHCILNSFENYRIVPMAESVGATWTAGGIRGHLNRHARNPLVILRMLAEIVLTSGRMLRDAIRFRPTHVFLPEFMSVVRNAPALAILRLCGVTVVCRLANHPESVPFYLFLFRNVLPHFVDCFVANSAFATKRLHDAGVTPAKIRTIHNTLATRTIDPQTDSDVVEIVHSMPTILSVGQLAPFKGTHLFVEAVLEIVGRNPDTQAVIVGRKPEWPPERALYIAKLEQQIADAGLSSRIRFVGECENVPAIMNEATVLALPIIQEETFGNVALEALSAGLPVVTFASGGLPELVEDGVTGTVCAEPTVESLVSGIERYLLDPAVRARASKASLRRFADPASTYSRESFERNWSSLFQERF